MVATLTATPQAHRSAIRQPHATHPPCESVKEVYSRWQSSPLEHLNIHLNVPFCGHARPPGPYQQRTVPHSFWHRPDVPCSPGNTCLKSCCTQMCTSVFTHVDGLMRVDGLTRVDGP
eukprot:358130-Chlamydomonas_euryale.AAC.5